MSDRQVGAGWWLASDGKWYPPESHPDALSAPKPASGTGRVRSSDRPEGPGWWRASDDKWYPPESHADALSAPKPASGMEYAGFWLWAWLLDLLIVAVGSFILAGVLALIEPTGGLAFVGIVAGWWLYFALQESSAAQATVGKRALGIRVTDLNGSRLTFGKATGRFFGKAVTGLIPFGIGWIMAGFTERKQALHDMIAGTLVVRALRRPSSCF